MPDALISVAAARHPPPLRGHALGSHRPRLLLLDDEAALRNRLSRTFADMGYAVLATAGVSDVRARLVAGERFDAAILDLRLGDGNGLDLIGELRRSCPRIRIVVVTAYSSIATAVVAIKAGAVDYLTKPADADAIARALADAERGRPPSPELPMPPDRVRWEHIQRLYEQCGRNVSATARHLGMHRRSLQRILAKRAPREQSPPRHPAGPVLRGRTALEAQIGA